MSRYAINLKTDTDKQRAAEILSAAPLGSRFEIKAAKRSTDQNSRMWAMLTEVAQQVPWHGVTLRPDDWKLIFLNALKRECRMVPNLDGNGFVDLGRSSSDLSKAEMTDLIELMFAFGAKRGVKFQDDAAAA